MDHGIVSFKNQKDINAARREQTDKLHRELLEKVETLVQENKKIEMEIRKEIIWLQNDSLSRFYQLFQLHNSNK